LSLAREIVYLHLANARKRLNAHSSIELLYIVSGGISIDCTIIKLSPRGEEIFKFIMQGWSGKQISKHLGISKSAVRRHKEKMLLDNDCKTIIELISKCYANNSLNTNQDD